MIRILSWNISKRNEAWKQVVTSNYDIALLQEANEPSETILESVEMDSQDWKTEGNYNRNWRAAIVKMNSSIEVNWLKTKSVSTAQNNDFPVSQMGSISAAEIYSENIDPILLISMYGVWQTPHKSIKSSWIYADASVHRIISDISCFIGAQKKHRIIAAGDLNVLHGHGEDGSTYWKNRYQTIFDRMEALGLHFIGPQFPNGRQANPWPDELPPESLNVPTFHSNQQNPETATRQLDFVFASDSLKSNIKVNALNTTEEWGPSDHCRIEILLKEN